MFIFQFKIKHFTLEKQHLSFQLPLTTRRVPRDCIRSNSPWLCVTEASVVKSQSLAMFPSLCLLKGSL